MPTVLLLNDKFDPGWKVWVDDKPAGVLRANFIMRGVHVPAGNHAVEFRFQPPVKGLYVTLAALALGMVLAGVLLVARFTAPAEKANPASVVVARKP